MSEEHSDLKERLIRSLSPMPIRYTWSFTPEEAQAALQFGEFDLVLCDHHSRRGANGLDLWRFCLGRHPKLPFILFSGLPGIVVQETVSLQLPKPPVLGKPFSPAELRIIIQSLLSPTNKPLNSSKSA